MNDPQRHNMSPHEECLNPYSAPESTQERAADQFPDFASRKRSKLIQLLLWMAITGFVTGIFPEDSSTNRVADLATGIGIAMLILGWCVIDREEHQLDRWRFFVPLMVLCPGPILVLPVYLFVTRGVGGFAATAMAIAFSGLMLFVRFAAFDLGLLLTGGT